MAAGDAFATTPYGLPLVLKRKSLLVPTDPIASTCHLESLECGDRLGVETRRWRSKEGNKGTQEGGPRGSKERGQRGPKEETQREETKKTQRKGINRTHKEETK